MIGDWGETTDFNVDDAKEMIVYQCSVFEITTIIIAANYFQN